MYEFVVELASFHEPSGLSCSTTKLLIPLFFHDTIAQLDDRNHFGLYCRACLFVFMLFVSTRFMFRSDVERLHVLEISVLFFSSTDIKIIEKVVQYL